MNGISKVQVAIIGGGSIAPFHAKYLQSSQTCNLVAIIDPFASGRDLAKTLGIAHFETVADSVSSRVTQPELYYVCVPSGLHVKLAIDVLENAEAKVILVEKPLSTDSVSGEKLLSLADAKGCTIAAGHHRRFHPAIKAAKKAISAGRLGKLTAISGSWAFKKNESYFNLGWRKSRTGGGGVVWTNFVHDIDLLHYLVGANVIRIWVTESIRRRRHNEVKENDSVEEGAAIMMQFGNGVVGTFLISDNVSSPFAWEAATGENPLLPKAEAPVDCFRVFGTEGALTVPDGNLWQYHQQDADERGLEIGWNVPMSKEVLETDKGIPFQDQAEQLARVVRGVEKPVCSGADGLVAVKVCEAIVNALDEGNSHPIDIR